MSRKQKAAENVYDDKKKCIVIKCHEYKWRNTGMHETGLFFVSFNYYYGEDCSKNHPQI